MTALDADGAPLIRTKAVGDINDHVYNFSSAMGTSEAINVATLGMSKVYQDNVLVATGDTAEVGATDPVVVASLNIDSAFNVRARVSGGVAGLVYEVLIKVMTDGGQTLHGNGFLLVGER